MHELPAGASLQTEIGKPRGAFALRGGSLTYCVFTGGGVAVDHIAEIGVGNCLGDLTHGRTPASLFAVDSNGDLRIVKGSVANERAVIGNAGVGLCRTCRGGDLYRVIAEIWKVLKISGWDWNSTLL